jgi:hypothetical protein
MLVMESGSKTAESRLMLNVAEPSRAGGLCAWEVVSVDEVTLKRLVQDPALQVVLVVASADATAFVEASKVGAAVAALAAAAIAEASVTEVVVSAEVAAIAVSDSRTATALLLMHLQVLGSADATEMETAMVHVVGMTVVVAHMMTGLDVTAADLVATAIDAVAAAMQIMNLSGVIGVVTSISQETMTDSTAGNVDSKEDTKTLASCVATKGSLGGGYLPSSHSHILHFRPSSFDHRG